MIKVCHLISSCITHHGPTNVILPVILGADPGRFNFAVCSLYPPPPDRHPGQLLANAGASFHVFEMGGFLDLGILIPLVKQLRRLRPDILHCHLVRANVYGRVAARLAGIPVVLNTHHGIEDYMLSDAARDRAVRRFERMSDSLVTRHVAVSQVMRRAAIDYLHIAPERITAIPNGVDLALYDPERRARAAMRQELGLSADAIVVGSVGILNETKNFQLLIRIAKDVLATHPHVQFVIFGEGEERPILEKMIADLGLTGSVLLAGFRADVARCLAALDIFALTSRSEGFGLAVAEAMASGLPCVAFDVGALAELVADGRTGLLAPAGDAAGFGRRIAQFVESPQMRSEMGRAAAERARVDFSAAAMAQKYSELYESF